MKKQAKDWLRYAKTDLQSTKALITDEDLTSAVAFHSQQCIEKSLKALLELNDKKVPRIHDLRKLLKTIEAENIISDIEIDDDILDQINQVYIDTRYPADYGILPDGNPSLEKVRKFMILAEDIFKVAEQIINIDQ